MLLRRLSLRVTRRCTTSRSVRCFSRCRARDRGESNERSSMPVTFANDILPLFRQVDIEHMAPFDIFLDRVEWMTSLDGGSVGSSPQYGDHANARGVYSYLTGETRPQM